MLCSLRPFLVMETHINYLVLKNYPETPAIGNTINACYTLRGRLFFCFILVFGSRAISDILEIVVQIVFLVDTSCRIAYPTFNDKQQLNRPEDRMWRNGETKGKQNMQTKKQTKTYHKWSKCTFTPTLTWTHTTNTSQFNQHAHQIKKLETDDEQRKIVQCVPIVSELLYVFL